MSRANWAINKAMKNNTIKQFAEKWDLAEGTVNTIWIVIKNTGNKYGKVSRMLRNLGVNLSPRQLRYFYRKIQLTEKYGTREDIGSDNFKQMIKNKI